ncbi:class I SAM-dependent methyltransferase [Paenibacillus sp. CMAA1364]
MAGTLSQVITGLLMLAVLGAVMSIVYASWKNGISPMPSSSVVRRAVIAEINRLDERGLIVEAGSGWGTLALDIARRKLGSQVIGIENSSIPLWISRAIIRLKKVDNVSFIRGDLYHYSYDDAQVVLCYLYPGAMMRLSQLFKDQLRHDAVVISVCFAIPDWQPERVITCRDFYRTKIYVYRKT